VFDHGVERIARYPSTRAASSTRVTSRPMRDPRAPDQPDPALPHAPRGGLVAVDLRRPTALPAPSTATSVRPGGSCTHSSLARVSLVSCPVSRPPR
jgi:hypothetical protein